MTVPKYYRRWFFMFATTAACLSIAALLLAQGPPPAPEPREIPNQSTDPLLRGFEFRSIGPATMMGRVDDIAGSEKDPDDHLRRLRHRRIVEVHRRRQSLEVAVRQHGRTNPSAPSPSRPPIRTSSTSARARPTTGRVRRSATACGAPPMAARPGRTWAWTIRSRSAASWWIRPIPNIVYVAAIGHLFGPNPERGLYKSTDGGKTWKKSKYIDTIPASPMSPSIPPIPRSSTRLRYQRRRTWWGYNGGGPGSALWKTTDGGDTWTKLDGPGWPKPKDGIYGRIAISIFRAKPTIDLRAGGSRRERRNRRRHHGGWRSGPRRPRRRGGESAAAAAAEADAPGAAEAGRGGGGGGGGRGRGSALPIPTAAACSAPTTAARPGRS